MKSGSILVYPAAFTGVYNIFFIEEVPEEVEFAGFNIVGDGSKIWLSIYTRDCPLTSLDTDTNPLSVENLITFAG